jgi:hypothetical protein
LFRQAKKVCGVGRPQTCALAPRRELFAGILLNRLQHDEAGLARHTLLLTHEVLHEILVDEGRDAIEHPKRRFPFEGADGLHHLQGAPADEYGQAREKQLLVGREQVVAPVDGIAQRLLACRQVTRTPGEHSQPAAQLPEQRLGWQNMHPRGRQLDGQR